mgnify:CR=1 FL=1
MSWWGGAALSLVLTASVACGRSHVEQQRTPPRVVHTGWGKRRALAGALLPLVEVQRAAC